MPLLKMTILSIVGGVFVSLGGMFFLVVSSDVKGGYGVQQLLGGLVFTTGLFLVSVAGAELFTGNNLVVMAAISGKVPLRLLFRNWAIVWTGNLIGSLSVVALAYLAQHWATGGNVVGARALAVGASKVALPFGVAFYRAIFANALVCLGAWIAYGARTVGDKLLGMLLPVAAFVAMSMEHSVANMFFVPYAMLIKAEPAVTAIQGVPTEKLQYLTMAGFLQNLTAATLGNIVGGAVLIGAVYWAAYLRDGASPAK